jgi:D-alanine-D-alanine ligase
MNIGVEPDWWKTLFDEVYLVTDARSVDDAAVTRQEIDVFTALLPMAPQDRILDLCGGHGRHALELVRRGFRHCTVFDYSRPLLNIGYREAARRQHPVDFVQGDARSTGLASKTFDQVLILGNSLGYIPEPDADVDILHESLRLLKPGGRLLLDVTDGRAVRRKIAPSAWHEIGDDVVVCRQREVVDERICAREMVLSKTRGLIRDRTYGIRLYGAEELAALAAGAGFEAVQVHPQEGRHRGRDVGCMNHRLLVTACRPSSGRRHAG